MDTVIRQINLHGKADPVAIMDVEDWINDTACKLNLMLNGPLTAETQERMDEKQINPYDYVIEAGETVYGLAEGSVAQGSMCCYRKWKSGTLELWGRRQAGNVKIEHDSSWGGYESREGDHQRIIVWGDWPIQFTKIPSVSYRIASTDSATYAGGHQILESQFGRDGSELVNTMVTSPSFMIIRPGKLTLGHPVITFHAIGKWE